MKTVKNVRAKSVKPGDRLFWDGWMLVEKVTTDRRYKKPLVNIHLRGGSQWSALQSEIVKIKKESE